MSQRLLLIVVFWISCFTNCNAQDLYLVSGRVIDFKTKEPLAFVNMVINSNNNTGGTTDIDGKFSLRSPKPVRSILLSYVGYEPKTIPVGARTSDLLIQMV